MQLLGQLAAGTAERSVAMTTQGEEVTAAQR